MFSIGVNPSLLKVQNILNISNNCLSKSMQRLSTGMRINSAADDPAGYYVASGLNSQIRSLKTVQNNIAVGSSLLSTAEGSLGNINDMLNRLNDLALQGASTTFTDTQRGALVKEASNLVDEIKKLNRETMFNGMSVFGDMGNFSKAVANVVPSLASTVPLSAPVYNSPTSANAPAASVSAASTPPKGSNTRTEYIFTN